MFDPEYEGRIDVYAGELPSGLPAYSSALDGALTGNYCNWPDRKTRVCYLAAGTIRAAE